MHGQAKNDRQLDERLNFLGLATVSGKIFQT